MARVGSLAILFGEVNIGIDEIIEQNRDRIPPNQIELQRKLLLKKRLQDKIKTMLVYLDAKRSIPPEGFPQIEQSLSKQFETEGVKNMMKKAKLSTRAEMDARLQSLGTSLEREKRTFIQNMIAAQWIREQVDADEEVTHAQMLKWYEQNRARFEKPPRARWEELKANFSRYPSRAEAFAAIAAMGNRVQQGEPFAQVAAASSNGSTASEGGDRDWTNVGVLASKELERALFGLPRGKLSPIIETRTGYCIVRVTERVDVTCTPFGEAQAEIRELIKEERREKQRQAYVAKLREQIPVWTMFDAEEKAAAEAARRKDPPRYSRY